MGRAVLDPPRHRGRHHGEARVILLHRHVPARVVTRGLETGHRHNGATDGRPHHRHHHHRLMGTDGEPKAAGADATVRMPRHRMSHVEGAAHAGTTEDGAGGRPLLVRGHRAQARALAVAAAVVAAAVVGERSQAAQASATDQAPADQAVATEKRNPDNSLGG